MNIILYIYVCVYVCVYQRPQTPLPRPVVGVCGGMCGYVGVCGGYVVLLVGLDGLIQP
jgi:hypothetical protein